MRLLFFGVCVCECVWAFVHLFCAICISISSRSPVMPCTDCSQYMGDRTDCICFLNIVGLSSEPHAKQKWATEIWMPFPLFSSSTLVRWWRCLLCVTFSSDFEMLMKTQGHSAPTNRLIWWGKPWNLLNICLFENNFASSKCTEQKWTAFSLDTNNIPTKSFSESSRLCDCFNFPYRSRQVGQNRNHLR